MKFDPGTPMAYREGSVGWAVTTPTIRLPDGRSISPRWTGVFRNEGGDWKIVQLHVSFGVPNEEVGWILPERESAKRGS